MRLVQIPQQMSQLTAGSVAVDQTSTSLESINLEGVDLLAVQSLVGGSSADTAIAAAIGKDSNHPAVIETGQSFTGLSPA